MTVEIGALLSKDFGQKVLEELNNFEGVKSISVETGRSSDLFEEKQFGTFGEAAIVLLLTPDRRIRFLMHSMTCVSLGGTRADWYS